MIPRVKDWKITVKETGEVWIISAINKRFARWLFLEQFGFSYVDKTLKISVI